MKTRPSGVEIMARMPAPSKVTTHLIILGCLLLTGIQWRTALADQVLLSCNFERGCEGAMVQEEADDDMDFELGSGWQGEWSTGPEADYTFKNVTGKYFFINANGDSVEREDRAVLHLPMPDMGKFRAGHAELSLAYHMYDGYGARNQMGMLSVVLECGDERNVTWSADGNQGDKWKTATIPIECEGLPAQVSIEAERNGVQSDIAIDDVRFVDIFDGSLLPATQSPLSEGPSSSRGTPSPPRVGSSSTTLLTKPRLPGTSGRTVSPGATGGVTVPPGGGSNGGLGLDIIVPIAAAALVAIVLIIVLIIVLLVHRQRKMKKTGGETLESPPQLYENNIFSDSSPDRKYESLQGPLSSSDRIYEELHSKKSTLEMQRPSGVPIHPHHQPQQYNNRRYHQTQQQQRAPAYPAPTRTNGHVPLAVRRSMPELGDNFYDRINERAAAAAAAEQAAVPANNNSNGRSDNHHNSYIDRSQTYHPSRTSYPEDHPYFTLMPDVVSSSAVTEDGRILFTIPPPPSSSPPPLPPAPRDYDYGRPLASNLPLDEDDLSDVNEYHHVMDVNKRRPLSLNSNFDDEDDLGRQRLAMDIMAASRGFEMGSNLRLSRDTDLSGRLDLDFDADVEMRMSADGSADIHSMDTMEMRQTLEPGRERDRERNRRSRDLELERNLDHQHQHRPYGGNFASGGFASVGRGRNIRLPEEQEEEMKDYHSSQASNYSNHSNHSAHSGHSAHSNQSGHSDHSPYHHIEEDAQGHIRMVNLNYSPSVVHV